MLQLNDNNNQKKKCLFVMLSSVLFISMSLIPNLNIQKKAEPKYDISIIKDETLKLKEYDKLLTDEDNRKDKTCAVAVLEKDDMIVETVNTDLITNIKTTATNNARTKMVSDPTGPETTQNKDAVQSNEFGNSVVAIAKKYLGVPYVWGGTNTNGFDCSGFVYYVFNQAGYKLSRNMQSQYNAGTPVSKDDLQPGDIVFFQGTYSYGLSHVGIYTGDGKFIHAPRTGSHVSYSDLNSSYFSNHWYGACRIEV